LKNKAPAQYYALDGWKSILQRARMPMARYKKRVSHAKEAFYIVCIVIFLFIGLFSYLGPGGYLEMKKAQAELAVHQSKVEALQKTKKERERTVEVLGDSRKGNEAIEAYARKKGYAKTTEIIQEVPPQAADQPQPKK
jgi:cell division protein FtsB